MQSYAQQPKSQPVSPQGTYTIASIFSDLPIEKPVLTEKSKSLDNMKSNNSTVSSKSQSQPQLPYQNGATSKQATPQQQTNSISLPTIKSPSTAHAPTLRQ
jgi:hypothetical protein